MADPFQLFEDSDDEIDAPNNDSFTKNSRCTAIELAKQANVRMVSSSSQTRKDTKNNEKSATEADHGSVSPTEARSIIEAHDLKWNDPEYLGPILLVVSESHIGGGRMAVASRDLVPGTLLLLEKPLATWSSEDNHLDISFVRMILDSCSDKNELLHQVEGLHPCKGVVDQIDELDKISDIDQVKLMMKELQEQHDNNFEIDKILEDLSVQNVKNSDGTPFVRSDLLRFMLAMRYNALETGLYMYTAMLNHANMPNCVKFKGGYLSEVRTTRYIRKGDMLTISYVPKILSHASRRRHLWQQHRFDIGKDIPDDFMQLEVIAGSVPRSSIDKEIADTVTNRIETTVYELSSQTEELEVASEVDPNMAIALELSSQELCSVADEQLQNKNHILMLPCLKLHVDACALVQKTSISASVRVKLLERFLHSALRLLTMQKLYHGPDHFDVARTDLDLAQGISELLSRNPQKLLSLHLHQLQTLTQWASYENELRKDYQRIKGLYEGSTS